MSDWSINRTRAFPATYLVAAEHHETALGFVNRQYLATSRGLAAAYAKDDKFTTKGRKMTLDIDALLKKNANVRDVFEKNKVLLSKCPPAKMAKYRLGDPYGARRPVDDIPVVSQPRPKASYIVI